MPTKTNPDLTTLRKAGLRTGRFATFKPDQGVPVRTSVGYPRFWRHGALPHARAVTPTTRKTDPGDREAAYRLDLSAHADDVLAELAAIARAHPGRPLVLLCFEENPADCHRSWLAAWLHDRFALDVQEVTT